MSEFRAVILDLDGTVVEPTPSALPSERVVNAVKNTVESQTRVSVATGRPYWMAKNIINRLGVVDFCAINGGAEVYDPVKDERVYYTKIPRLSQRAVVTICHNMGIDVYDAESQVVGTPIERPSAVDENNVKLFISGLEEIRADELLEELRPIDDVFPVKSTSWSPGEVVDIHITHNLATKEQTAKAILEAYGIDPDHSIGIGDSCNDMPLFAVVGRSFAMGNSHIDLKNVADDVTASLKDDGVAVVLEKFFPTPASSSIKTQAFSIPAFSPGRVPIA
ncbi:MAG TPA: HAD family hydrolase [Candidatus Saccharimonadales bacterium]|nr:HAD family hydrolase [Candidatus Saccharimonadales bacterium]